MFGPTQPKINDLTQDKIGYDLPWKQISCTFRVQWPTGAMANWSNGLVVKALDSQSRGPVFKTAGWLQGRLSLSSSRGR